MPKSGLPFVLRRLTLGAIAASLVLAACPAARAGDGEAGNNSAHPQSQMDGSGADAATPSEPKERAQQINDLFGRLAKATSASDAEPIKAQIRQLWRDSGSPTIDLLLVRDVEAALANDSATRRRLLEAVTHLAPDSTEGWNRRAEFDYAEQRFGEAIADLGHVLAIEPRHFDALEGFASLMKETGHDNLALEAFRQLKQIDPTSANLNGEIDDLARKVEGQKI